MYYEKYTFQYPNFIRISNVPTSTCTFINCNFRAVEYIKLSGFKKVIFAGAKTVFNPKTRIAIEHCGDVKFGHLKFKQKGTTLNMIDVPLVIFNAVQGTHNMKLQTQQCEMVKYIDSVLDFDTSDINTQIFDIYGTQFEKMKQLNMMGVSEEMHIIKSKISDVQEIIIQPKIKLFTDNINGTKEILQQITKYQIPQKTN